MNTEVLHHFVCSKCRGWWSIAAEEKMKHRNWFCPWCGWDNDGPERVNPEEGNV